MLTQHLEECNRYISLAPADRKVVTEHYNLIRDHVIDKMKSEDKLFKKIFHRAELSGSYADRVKISKPDEYDVLLILKLPDVVVEKLSNKPGYVQIRSIKRKQWYGIEKILDHDGYLMQHRVLEWLRRIMKNIFPDPNNTLIIERTEYIVSHSINGPANTLKIKCVSQPNRDVIFSVDFVGALKFPVKVWAADNVTLKQRFLNSCWHAIPKPRKSTPKPNHSLRPPHRSDASTFQNRRIRNLNKNRLWICSYATIERELIQDFQFIKPLIRIFKKIRDTQNLTNLKSYYIKQIFIHKRMHEEPDYWEQSLGELFLEMLDEVIECMRSRNLASYWHEEYNLLNNFNRKQIIDIENKFRRIKHDLDTHGSDYIYEVILTDNEQREIQQFV